MAKLRSERNIINTNSSIITTNSLNIIVIIINNIIIYSKIRALQGLAKLEN